MASLAGLSVQATRLCPHCVTPLFGQVAYCPYCGHDGTGALDGVAPAVAPVRFETVGANDAGPVPEPAMPELPLDVPARRNRGGMVAFGLCIVALVGSGIYFMRVGTPVPPLAPVVQVAPAVAPRAAERVDPPAAGPREEARVDAATALGIEIASQPQAPAPTLPAPAPRDAGCSDAMAALSLCATTPPPPATP